MSPSLTDHHEGPVPDAEEDATVPEGAQQGMGRGHGAFSDSPPEEQEVAALPWPRVVAQGPSAATSTAEVTTLVSPVLDPPAPG